MKNENSKDNANKNAVSLIRELMDGWNKIESAAKKQFPNADKEELFQICSGAMNHALRLKSAK